MATVETNDRVQWLEDFTESIRLAQSVARSIDRNGEILSLSGNVIMGQRLEGLATTLTEALNNADAAITRMIHEEVQASSRQFNETMVGVLKVALGDQ
jgi:hypothetical protein